MKIEKVNDNQIRCTLTKEDLAKRELKLSELAYGSEKAKNLFRDMMQQANFEFGFEAEDIPLMIEAIPLNSECIVLIITKVEDPEELDTRFSRFTPSPQSDEQEDDFAANEAAEQEVMDLFRRVQDAKKDSDSDKEETVKQTITRVFSFASLKQIINASVLMSGSFTGENSLYKDTSSDSYLLVLSSEGSTDDAYDRTCNILSEYGSLKAKTSGNKSFLEEHCEAVLMHTALQSLGQIK